MKEISVVIPCFNVEKYIDKCVDSLVHQTFGIHRMELIFVNDASTDQTLEKLAAWEQQYPDSITVITLTKNSKQGTARNVGMQYASGEYLGFIDADDYVELTMYQKMYDVYQKEDVNCVICGRYNEYSDGTKLVFGPVEDGMMDLTSSGIRRFKISVEAYSGIVQRLYKRSWLLNLDIWFPEGISYEDNFFVPIVDYYTEKVWKIKEPLYHYQINNTSTTQKRNELHHLDRLKIELMKLDELMNRELYVLYQENIEFDFLRMYFSQSLIMLLNKFDEFPEGIIQKMQQTTQQLFPKWRENPLLQLDEEAYLRCQMIDYPFIKGDRSEVLSVYNSVMDRANI